MKKLLITLVAVSIARSVFGQAAPQPPVPPQPPERAPVGSYAPRDPAVKERGWWNDPFSPVGMFSPVDPEERTFLVGYTRAGPRAEFPQAELIDLFESVREQYRDGEDAPVARRAQIETGPIFLRDAPPRDFVFRDEQTKRVLAFPLLGEVEGAELTRERFVEHLKAGHVFKVAHRAARDCKACYGRGQARGNNGARVDALVECRECRGSGKVPSMVLYTVKWE